MLVIQWKNFQTCHWQKNSRTSSRVMMTVFFCLVFPGHISEIPMSDKEEWQNAADWKIFVQHHKKVAEKDIIDSTTFEQIQPKWKGEMALPKTRIKFLWDIFSSWAIHNIVLQQNDWISCRNSSDREWQDTINDAIGLIHSVKGLHVKGRKMLSLYINVLFPDGSTMGSSTKIRLTLERWFGDKSSGNRLERNKDWMCLHHPL